LAAVLGTADRDGGMGLVEIVEPGTVHGGVTAVPAEVMVVGNGIRDLCRKSAEIVKKVRG
ncbi:MAG: hypothetical protein IKK98_01365, partial [Oscillospiraceae bacterium]|nr:hypothetical protein [Oscillospiraceae bacterium]